MTVNEEEYKFAFMAILDYSRKQEDAKDTFPIFMMGNSLQTFVKANAHVARTLHPMPEFTFKNMQLKMLDELHPGHTYLFDGMTREEQQAVFNAGKFLNSQNIGLRMRELNLDAKLNQTLDPIAIFRNFNEDGTHS